MAIVSIIGPKGGIGKTTLSINTAAALTRALEADRRRDRVCLIDLDLRLPTISSLLDSHPKKTFYDLFETLANKTYQVDYLQTVYRILSMFRGYLDGDVPESHPQLGKAFSLYKHLGGEWFHFSDFAFGPALQELFLERGRVHHLRQIRTLAPLLDRLDLRQIQEPLRRSQANARPLVEDYVNFIEEYGFSLIGGEVPVLGKRNHRKRINEPAFLVLFLEFLNEVFDRFEYAVLDTPAGGVNHLSSLMNWMDQVILVFDMSNPIAVNGSMDALHTFIDYYEDFHRDFNAGRLTGLDKAYVNRLNARHGRQALADALDQKKIGILFNRCRDDGAIEKTLHRLREYLDTLDKYEAYRDRIHILGMLPQHRIINITNNRGALFYGKDGALSSRMDQVARAILERGRNSPTLAFPDAAILRHLQEGKKPGWPLRLGRIAGLFS